MKLFAFILAFIFSMQVGTPLICATSCENHVTEHSCCRKDKMKCGMDTQKQENSKHKKGKTPFAAKDCCTPCCAVPMFCCYYHDPNEIKIATFPSSNAGQLPSSNGNTVDGFLAEILQPPEMV